jgi:hypothetical protein
MRISHCVHKATDTHSEYIILILFHCKSGCTNAPEWFVVRKLAVSCLLSRSLIFRLFVALCILSLLGKYSLDGRAITNFKKIKYRQQVYVPDGLQCQFERII